MKIFLALICFCAISSHAKSFDSIELNLITMKDRQGSLVVHDACQRIDHELKAKIQRFIDFHQLESDVFEGEAKVIVKPDRPTRWSQGQFIYECRLIIKTFNPDFKFSVNHSKNKHRGDNQLKSCLEERDELQSQIHVLYTEFFPAIFSCQNLNIVKITSAYKVKGSPGE